MIFLKYLFIYVLKFYWSKFDQNSLSSGYTIVWSIETENEEKFFTNPTLVDKSRASKMRLTMSGYYSTIRNDIRKLYYAINEIIIKGRFVQCLNYILILII